MLLLAQIAPFAQGGNRLCFVHPNDPLRCIKVRRPDFSLADRRRKKGFPKNLRPLSSFDDNLEELRVMADLDSSVGEHLYQHVSHCYGFVTTDMGPGLVSELIRNDDGSIAETLKKYIWDHGFTEDCQLAVSSLCDHWRAQRIPSRDLLLHNIVTQMAGSSIVRLVVIDGLGSPSLVPFRWLPLAMRSKRIERKIANLYQRIHSLLSQRGQEKFPGYHGLLLHNDRPEIPFAEAVK
ncbi:MAG: hypothetical protein KGZ88_00020 [Methylomicrobium sp.]|nr:hypothetical protein [Methylomicrobium sp.]